MAKNHFYGRLDTRRAMMMAAPFCAIFAAQSAHAVDHNPTDLASLRTALIAVNGTVSNDRIFLPAGTITLDAGALDNSNVSGDLDVFKATGTLEIIGAGQTTTILDGDGLDRVFHLNAASNITISDLTVRNGLATDDGITSGDAFGGGILHAGGGTLTLINVTITQNEAAGADGSAGTSVTPGGGGGQAEGGGLYRFGGALTITDCIISNNTASGGNGGNGAKPATSFASSTAVGSTGSAGGFGGDAIGGGIMAQGTTGLTITGTTISGNIAAGGDGGIGGAGGDAVATGTGATAVAYGGSGGDGGLGGNAFGAGIYFAATTLDITASCISGNSATGGAGGLGGAGGDGSASGAASSFSGGAGGSGGFGGTGGTGLGGGVYLDAGDTTIVNSTLSGNSAGGAAGGNGGNGGDGLGGTTTLPGSGADGGNGGDGQGGGVFMAVGGTLTISNATIAFNTASGGNGGLGGAPGPGGTSSSSGLDGSDLDGVGGGIFVSFATVTLDSTIVSNNSADTANQITGTSITADACIFGSSVIGVTPGPNGNQIGNPNLSALAFNGGPTRNHRIGENSIARDAGTNPLTLTTDQRGQPRNDGGGVDIGAFEFTDSIDAGGGPGNDDGGGGEDSSCSTGTGANRFWLLAPLLAIAALFRRRRA